MKIFATIFVLLIASGNVYALNLGDALKSIGEGSAKEINSGLDKKLDKIVGKYEKKIEKYEGEIKGEVDKYKAQIKEAEKSLTQLMGLKARAEKYLKIAKIVTLVLSSGILVLLFIMWRIWRGVVNTRKLVQNVSNYKEFDKRLKVLEGKVL